MAAEIIAQSVQHRQRALIPHISHHLLTPSLGLARSLAVENMAAGDNMVTQVVIVQNILIQHR